MRELTADTIERAGRERRQRRRRELLVTAGLLVVVAALTVIAGRAGLFEVAEARTQDLFFRLRNRIAAPTPPGDIVIVAIDDPSFRELELQWPWPRAVHADLVDSLTEAGAAVIGFDVLFTDPSAFGEADDALFAAAMERSGRVVLAEDVELAEDRSFVQQSWIRPLDRFLDSAAATGMVSVSLDRDGFVRRAPLATLGEPAFAVAVAALADGVDPTTPAASFGVPTEPTEPVVIDFLGVPRVIKTVSYYQALDWRSSLPPDLLRDAIVLVGFALSGAASVDAVDHFAYPFRAEARGPIPGVEVHASLVDTLRRRRYLVPLPTSASSALFAICLAGGALALFRLPGWRGSVLFVAVAGAFSIATFLCFLWGSMQGPLITPLAGFALYGVAERSWRMAVVDREKRFIQKAFQHYVAPAVVEQIVADPTQLQLYGAAYETTVVFTDLVGFTSLAEDWEPMRLRAFLTDYFTEMVEIMRRHRGTLDKFIGDALMCFFGVPVRSEDHALDAALCGWQMHQRLLELNVEWAAQGLPPLAMRVGVNTGRVVAGNIGTRDLFNYTIMGDCVNLGSRLEGANKFYGTAVMIGETTYAAAGERLDTRRLDRIRVKGKQQPISIYELLGPRGTVDDARREQIELYQQALESYVDQRFAAAIELLGRALAIGADPPSEVLLERCRRLSNDPPPADWDGVWVLTSK